LSNNKSFDQPTRLNDNGNEVTNAERLATKFNNYFGSVGLKLAAKFNNSDHVYQNFLLKDKKVGGSIALVTPTCNEVLNELTRLKAKIFPGSDDLAPYFIKIAFTAIAPFLTHLTDFIFSQGIFPDLLKIAKVVPIFKSGDKTLTKNYRPISLLPSFSKVIEKLIKTRMLSFLNRNNVLYDRQSGFRKNHCTLLPIIDLITDCFDNINAGAYTCIATLDFKKSIRHCRSYFTKKNLNIMVFVEIVTTLFQATYLIENNMLVSRGKILDLQT